MVVLENALLGIIAGGIYALSATGIVLTFTTTGVFNLAYFAVALLAGYLGWELNGVLGVPLYLAVPIVLVLCGPVLGVVLERLVFRPLQARSASSSEKLVASLGVTVVILAAVNLIWGPGLKGSTDHPVPRLFAVHPLTAGSLRFDTEQIGVVATIVVVAGLLWLLLQHTLLGTRIRAVVDRRDLAELAAIDANRISQVAWSLGCTLGALTGLLIAPPTLEPTRIIILGIETFSVAVVAGLTSIPIALLFGFFVMGMGRSLMDGFAPFGDGSGNLPQLYDQVVLNLSSLVLFGALVMSRRSAAGAAVATAARESLGRARQTRPVSAAQGLLGLAAAVAVPFLLDGSDLRNAQRFLAFVLIFASITAITGFSGLLTLGQASIAGLGAFATARFTAELDVPVLVALLPGIGVATLAGLIAAWPALKRQAGLFLGLATLGLALIIYQFVFNARLPLIAGGSGMLQVERPHLFGLDLSGDRAFWYFEVVVVVLALALVNNLRRGPLGRVLAALRDSEVAASSVGIDLRMAKLFVFGVSSAIAGLGGVLLTQADQSWDAQTFYPVFGLFWLTAVMVCGVASIRGAVLAAALYVAVPVLTGQDVQSAVGLFGIGCLFLGYLPGGIVGQGRRLPEVLRVRLARAWTEAVEPVEAPRRRLAPSPLGRRLVARAAAREAQR